MAKKFSRLLAIIFIAVGCVCSFSACRPGLEFPYAQAIWACDEITLMTNGFEVPTGYLFIDGKEYAFSFDRGVACQATLLDITKSEPFSSSYQSKLDQDRLDKEKFETYEEMYKEIESRIIWEVDCTDSVKCMYGNVSTCRCTKITLNIRRDFLGERGETNDYTGKKFVLERQPLEDSQPLFVRSNAVWEHDGVSLITDGRANPFGEIVWQDVTYEVVTIFDDWGGGRICFADRSKLTEEDYGHLDNLSSSKYILRCFYYECTGCRLGIEHSVCFKNTLKLGIEYDYIAEKNVAETVVLERKG